MDQEELLFRTAPINLPTHQLTVAPEAPEEPPREPGTCAIDADCESGLCYSGMCADAVAGHVYVFGTSFQGSSRAADRMLSNAVFSAQRDVELVLYRGAAPANGMSSTEAALDRAATIAGHTAHITFADTSPAIAPLLAPPTADVLVIAAQPQATNEELQFMGDEWSLRLDDFARRGGTIIVLDTASENGGTAQVLAQSGLLSLGERATSVGSIAYVDAPADISARRVPLTFSVGSSAVGWATSTGTNVTISETGHAVVIHRAIY